MQVGTVRNWLRYSALAFAITVLATGELWAQCPDGTPPPCRVPEPATPPDVPEQPDDSEPVDRTTVLVVPPALVGVDTSLRQLAATFAAVVAENMTVGDVKARVAPELAELLIENRPLAARERNAGAVVDGRLIKIGPNLRATVWLVLAGGDLEVARTTVEGSQDSLLALADRASVVLLKEWWKYQPGPYLRLGITTSSVSALRHYIEGMVALREGREWRGSLDSAVRHDPDFLAPWIWLALPEPSVRSPMQLFLVRTTQRLAIQSLMQLGDFLGSPAAYAISEVELPFVTPDSARRALAAVESRQSAVQWFELAQLPNPDFVSRLTVGAVPPPTHPEASAFYDALEEMSRSPLVELRYVSAVAAHVATMAGYADTTALEVAVKALESDSTFVPAYRLLYNSLIDIGDTVRAREVAEAVEGEDDRSLYPDVSGRFAPPGARSRWSSVMGVYGVMREMQWHRFRDLGWELYGKKRGPVVEAEIEPPLGLVHIPLYLALGRRDSARSVIDQQVFAPMDRAWDSVIAEADPSELAAAKERGHLAEVDEALAAMKSLMLSLYVPIPPENDLYPAHLGIDYLDSIVAVWAVWEDGIDKGMSPGFAMPRIPFERVTRSMGNRLLAKLAWRNGTLANQAGDKPTALRSLSILDSLSSQDSIGILPLALGLRAEIAMRADSARVAVSLLVHAIGTSATRTPARFRWLLAKLYAETGRPELAVQMAHTITMPSRLHRLEHAFYYARALKLEAEMLEALGHLQDAIEKYETLADLRADADSTLQGEVTEVHIKLASLHFQNGEYDEAWDHVDISRGRGATPPEDLLAALETARLQPRTLHGHRPLGRVVMTGACPPAVYPDSLRAAGVGGLVLLEFVVDTTGRADPETIKVLETPHSELNPYAMDAIKLCRFKPRRERGRPVRTRWREWVSYAADRPDSPEGTRAVVTTSSSEAREKYHAAQRLFQARNRDAAIELLREVLALDPEFAMAWRALAISLRAIGQRDSSLVAIQRAMSLRDGVSETERLHIEAIAANYLDDDRETAIELYGRILQINPNDWIAHYNRRGGLIALGEYDAAIPHSIAVERLAPERIVRSERDVRFRTLLRVGRLDEAEALRDSVTRDVGVLGKVALYIARGEWQQAEAEATRIGESGYIPAGTNLALASARAARGSLWGADTLLLRGQPGPQLVSLLLSNGCTEALGRIEPDPFVLRETSVWSLVERGVLTAAIGDSIGAREILAQLNSEPAQQRGPYEARIALIEALQAKHSYEHHAVVDLLTPYARGRRANTLGIQAIRWLLGEAHESLGNLDSAVAYFGMVTDSVVPNYNAIRDRGFLYAFAHRRLAALYGRLGETEAAASHLRAFKAAFDSPDPELSWLLTESPSAEPQWEATCAGYRQRQYEAMIAALDLFRNAQQTYHDINGHYAAYERDVAQHYGRAGYRPAPGITIYVRDADADGWSARATKTGSYGACTISVGSGPATMSGQEPGAVICFRRDRGAVNAEDQAISAVVLTLEELKQAQWWYWTQHDRYATEPPFQLEDGTIWSPVERVKVEMVMATPSRFEATATHAGSPLTCRLVLGSGRDTGLKCRIR